MAKRKKPRKVTTPIALLGAIAHRPQTGYDLRSFYAQPHLPFWYEAHGQVYGALDKLVEQGLIEGESEESLPGNGKTTYTLTEEGEAELKRWLKSPQPKDGGIWRDERYLRLLYSEYASTAYAIQQLETLRSETEDNIAAIKAQDKDTLPPFAAKLAALALSREEVTLAWIEEVLDELL